jgi:chondroitin 4-sulfotransferase 11
MKKEQFVFIHIPKCGGNSITSDHFRNFSHDLRNENFKYFKDSYERSLSKFSFTFVRNPWDRLVSSYEYLKNGGNCTLDAEDYLNLFSKYENFKEMVLNWEEVFFDQIHFKSQSDWICDNDGNIIVDFVGKFENLQQDFDIVCDRMQIPRKKLPHTNKTNHKHYTEYYDDEIREIVAKKYARDIEYFGYKFGE